MDQVRESVRPAFDKLLRLSAPAARVSAKRNTRRHAFQKGACNCEDVGVETLRMDHVDLVFAQERSKSAKLFEHVEVVETGETKLRNLAQSQTLNLRQQCTLATQARYVNTVTPVRQQKAGEQDRLALSTSHIKAVDHDEDIRFSRIHSGQTAIPSCACFSSSFPCSKRLVHERLGFHSGQRRGFMPRSASCRAAPWIHAAQRRGFMPRSADGAKYDSQGQAS